ncbi:MAG: PIN domain-containing protein [Bacteroidia bacterium]|nr:PIN domain-containing protein [Bacteroidia bacterium]
MNRPRIYLDTSVINFIFAEDAPEKQEITIDFFENFVKKNIYETFVSEFVIDELAQTPDPFQKASLLSILETYPIEILELPRLDEVASLAQAYIDNGVLPGNKYYDALHIACCVTQNIDFLTSWNYKHLANVNRERRIQLLNIQLRYNTPLRIITPTELTGYGA